MEVTKFGQSALESLYLVKYVPFQAPLIDKLSPGLEVARGGDQGHEGPETNREEQCLAQSRPSQGDMISVCRYTVGCYGSSVRIFFLIIVEREADFHSTYRSSYSQQSCLDPGISADDCKSPLTLFNESLGSVCQTEVLQRGLLHQGTGWTQ